MNTYISKVLLGVVIVSLFPMSAALAYTYPQVQTNSVTNIQDVSAAFNGNVYDLGGSYSASVWFEYGTSTNYGYSTMPVSQNYTGNFSQAVGGLNPNTTYHVRAVVQSQYTTRYGQDVTFTTNGSYYNNYNNNYYYNNNYNLYATTNSATNVYDTQATLNGYVNAASYGSYVWFQWGTSTSYGNTTNSQQINYSGSVSQQIGNLSPNTVYHYRTVIQSNNGQIAYGQDVAFTTSWNNQNYNYNYNYNYNNRAAMIDAIRQAIMALQQILNNMR